MKRTHATVMLGLLLAGVLAAGACLGGSSTAREPFAIAWNYDTSGYLETCGCSAAQLGGLARRGTKLAELREKQPVLAIEGAHIVGDMGEFQLFKAQMAVNALNTMKYDALMLGVREAQHGTDGLAQLIRDADFPAYSANLSVDGQPWPTPSVSTTIGGTKVGITGASHPQLASFELPEGVSFGDPSAAIDAVLPELRRRSDLVVLTLEGHPAWLEEMIRRYRGQVDVFLSGNRQPETASLEYQSDPPHLNSYDRGRYMGLITVDSSPQGYSFTGSNLPLVDTLANLPDIQRILDEEYKPELKERFFGDFKESLTLYMPPSYCGDCHAEEVEVYERSGHAQALETLVARNQHYNPDCMQCHVTYDTSADQLHSMNCIVCHTNITDDHVWQAMEGEVVIPETPVTSYSYEWCYRCHDELNSANFKEHWPQFVNKIYHGGDLGPARAAAEIMGIDMSEPPPAHH